MRAGDDIWRFNEIIIDRARYPWEPDLADMLEAVIIAPTASALAKRYARAVHHAILEKIGVDDARLPLLYYDVRKRANPFTLTS